MQLPPQLRRVRNDSKGAASNGSRRSQRTGTGRKILSRDTLPSPSGCLFSLLRRKGTTPRQERETRVRVRPLSWKMRMFEPRSTSPPIFEQ